MLEYGDFSEDPISSNAVYNMKASYEGPEGIAAEWAICWAGRGQGVEHLAQRHETGRPGKHEE